MSRGVAVALVSGVLFGAGLTVSQMINPAKVLAFLDVAGDWDPSLALVMASAVATMSLAWWVHQRQSIRGKPAITPHSNRIDSPLVVGAILFGVGWGLVGYCPGPAIVALGLLDPEPSIFVLAMLAGMGLHRLLFAQFRAVPGTVHLIGTRRAVTARNSPQRDRVE